ncbi:MAG TPA: hypothetical protein ENK70_01460 [Methylophaga sp.]|nr:hypothetical protein [Methylophaga sp.]
MFTRNQHFHISLLAVFALLLGLVAAIPHYGHADASHDVSVQTHSHDESVVGNGSVDSATGNTNDGNIETECDHGCHLGHHFNVVLCGGQKSFTQIANHAPVSNPQKFSLITKRRDLRPPISQIS